MTISGSLKSAAIMWMPCVLNGTVRIPAPKSEGDNDPLLLKETACQRRRRRHWLIDACSSFHECTSDQIEDIRYKVPGDTPKLLHVFSSNSLAPANKGLSLHVGFGNSIQNNSN